MANEQEVDVGQLSAPQQEALQQYVQVTNQEITEAIPLLRRSQWNVQIAIAKFFDGEPADAIDDPFNDPTLAAPRSEARHENLQESLLRSSIQPRQPARDRPVPAPRIVPQPPRVNRPGLILGLLLYPLTIGYKLGSVLYRTILYILGFLPRSLQPRAITSGMTRGFRSANDRRMLLPRDTASRFRREFEETYGGHDLPFFDDGFAQAYDAAKRDVKLLLVVLMSPEHDETDPFVRETLLSPDVVAFINDPNNNIILWGGNILDSEAYQVSLEYNCTKFPFSALICLTPKEGSTKMGIVKRLVGPMSPTAYIAEIQMAINKYSPDLAGVRAERKAQEVARSLRNQQDSAYEKSLARDRERARQRREAEAAAAAAEKRAKDAAEAAARLEEKRQQWRRWRAGTITPEPPTSTPGVVRVALKLPESLGGERIIRRFGGDTTMEELYAFVECAKLLESDEPAVRDRPEDYEHKYRFTVASLMPRKVYEPSGMTTMGEAIGKSGNLIVEDLDEEEEDGEDDE